MDEELGQEELADMDRQGQNLRQRDEVNGHPPPDSPMSPNPNPPTPYARDIGLRAFAQSQRARNSSAQRTGRASGSRIADTAEDSEVFDSDTDSISKGDDPQRTRESTLDDSPEPGRGTGTSIFAVGLIYICGWRAYRLANGCRGDDVRERRLADKLCRRGEGGVGREKGEEEAGEATGKCQEEPVTYRSSSIRLRSMAVTCNTTMTLSPHDNPPTSPSVGPVEL